MTDDEYSVSLTFREWLAICHALGHTSGYYRTRDMEGQANKYEAITDEIAAGLQDND